MNLYAERDIMALGEYHRRHIDHMDSEALHYRSDIAAELAWRDKEIDRMKAALSDIANELSDLRRRLAYHYPELSAELDV